MFPLIDRVRIGVSLNNITGITGRRYELDDALNAAREAEAMGFGAVWVHDAPFGRRTVAAYDPVSVLSAAAGFTRKVALCTGIIAPHFRNPVLLAQQWATLFALSEGRAVLGVGAGAGTPTLQQRAFQALTALHSPQSAAATALYEARGRLFVECVELIRKLWANDKVTHDGEFYRVQDLTLGHARPQSPPSILMAAGIYFPSKPGAPVHHGWSEKHAGKYVFGPYKRVAELADGWITTHLTPDEYLAHWQRIQSHADEVHPGRVIAKAFNCFVNVNDDAVSAREEVTKHLADFHGPPIWDDVVDRWTIAGPPESVARGLQAYIDNGVRLFQLVIGSPNQLEQMRRIAERVLPLLRNLSR